MAGGIRVGCWSAVCGLVLLASPSIEAQESGRSKAESSMGTFRPAPSKSSAKNSTPKSSSNESKGGLFQQLKSITSDLLSSDDELAESDRKASSSDAPAALEARNRRPFENTPRRVIERNQSAAQRGMPTPPQIDPPSLPSSQPLPPIVSGSDAAKAATIDEEFAANQPKTNASEKSSTRRKFEKPSDAISQKIPEVPSSNARGGLTYPDLSSPADASTSSPSLDVPDDIVVKRKPIPVSAPASKSTPNDLPKVISKSADTPNARKTEETNADLTPVPSPPLSIPSALIQTAMPRLEVALAGPESLQINHPTTYQLVAANRDSLMLNGMIVRLGFPNFMEIKPAADAIGQVSIEPEEDGSKSLLWQLEQVEAGKTVSLSFDLVASKPEHFAVDMEWTALPQTGQSRVQVQQPQLQLAIEGPSEVYYGKPEIYRLRLKNPGNADVKDVQVMLQSDPESANSTSIGDLAAGAERVVEVELTFQEAGPISILAGASSEKMGVAAKNEIQIVVRQAKMEAQWQLPAQHFQGSTENYSLTIKNTSDMPAKQVACQIQLPKGCYVVSLPEGMKAENDHIVWMIPELASQGTSQYAFELEMTETGVLPLAFECNGEAGAIANATAQAKVDAIADLKMTVIDPVAPAPIGKPVTYELVIANRGTKPATGVRVLAQFSNGIEPTEASGQEHRIVPGQVLFEPIASIEPGKERTFKITAIAAEAGSHRFRAEVTCDDSGTQLIHEESTRYLATGRSDSSNSRVRR